jgi:hypothetical protein
MKSDMVAAAAREAARQSGLAMIHGKDDGGVAFFTSGDLFSDNVSFLPSPLLSLALGFDSFGDGTPLPLLFLGLWFECFGIELNPTWWMLVSCDGISSQLILLGFSATTDTLLWLALGRLGMAMERWCKYY